MVDNIDVTPGTGKTIAADDIGGVLFQRVKVAWGPDGTGNDADTATGKPLPIQVRSATGLVPIGEPTDDKNTATDTTSVSLISLVKQVSAYLGTLAGAVGSSKVATKSASGDFADGSIVTLGAKADAKSTATDTTAITIMQVAKQISASIQAAAASLAGALLATASGDVAHDAADSGNPVKVGAKAAAGLSGATLVSAADRINLVGGLDGALYVRNHCGLEDIVSGTASNTDGTSTEVIATAGSGVKQYLTRVSLSNTHATTSVMIALKSGTTSKYRVNVPPGGREIFFDPPLPPNAANEAWNFDPDSAVTTIECSMVGFKSKV